MECPQWSVETCNSKTTTTSSGFGRATPDIRVYRGLEGHGHLRLSLDKFGQRNDLNSSNFELGRAQVYYTSSLFEVRLNGTQPAQVTANTNTGPTSATLLSATRRLGSNDTMEEECHIATMDMTAVVSPPELRRTILWVLTTKHSPQLHSSAISFITSTLAQNGLLDQPLEWEEAIDALSQGIVDGQSDVDPHFSRGATRGGNQNVDMGPSDVVMAAALEQVYSRLVVADSAAHTTQGALASTFLANDAPAPSRAGTSAPWRGAIPVREEAAFQVHEANHSDLCIVIFSDLSTIVTSTEAAFYTDVWKDALDDIGYGSEGSLRPNDHQTHVVKMHNQPLLLRQGCTHLQVAPQFRGGVVESRNL
ncbi:uncharacterized protein UHO2_00417 [Ustilago hordei]|uniref:uncharacterized protein n=1 Tax=Ustilago hordei TaxID=120017 RepID=UPI001A4E0D1B|nr:uncharacterized protein UHO2_00417 [Ustilago hordei]SYW81925.1 uncharacterized protein UHO2_00417 [Ustilago hordei]